MEKDRKIRKLYKTYMMAMQHRVNLFDSEDDD